MTPYFVAPFSAYRWTNGIAAFAAVSATASLSLISDSPARAQGVGGGGGVPAGNTSVSPAPAAAAPVIRLITVEGARALKPRVVVAAAAVSVLHKAGDRDALQAVTKAVNALYREKGYPVAQVVSANVTPDGILQLSIAEGRVRRIVVRGNKKTRTATILEVLGTRAGDAYNTDSVKDDRNRLARLGLFNDVTITAQIPGAADFLPPGLQNTPASSSGGVMDEGKPGDPKPADSPASSGGGGGAASPHSTAPATGAETAAGGPPPAGGEAGAKTGAPAGAVGPATSDAGGTVAIVVAPNPPTPPPLVAEALPPDEDRVGDVDLVIRVNERQTANIAATIGYADVVGPVGFIDVSEANVQGTGQRVAAQWQRTSNSYLDSTGHVQRGDSRQAVNFSYEHPALGLHSTAYSFDLYNQNTVFLPSFTGVSYTIRTFETRDGATARIGHALSRKMTGYLTLRHDKVGYDENALAVTYIDTGDTSLLAPLSLLNNATGTVGAVGAILIGDGRDAADNPHKGYLNALTVEDSTNVLGGNRLFRQATLDVRQYIPLSVSKTGPVLATRVMTGYSQGDVPLSEQYFIGGYELLRGYELYSIYGDRMLLGSAELRSPLNPGVQGVAFVDAGNAWLPGDKFGSGGVKLGIGAGLRFLSPVGPLRFDLAYGDRFRTYVSLGQSF